MKRLNPHHPKPSPTEISRRWFLEQCGVGLGSMALGQLFAEAGFAAGSDDPLGVKQPHFAPKAKRVIFLFMAGAPSHLELFDYKPLLGTVVDDIALVKSMVTDAFNHAPGQVLMNTGSQQFGRPSMGSWVTYGLGSESKDLPAFVVFSSGKKGPSGGDSCWGSGFLPTVYQGVQFRTSGDPVLYLSNPPGVDPALQRDTLNSVKSLNQMRLNVTGDPEIATRINSFE